MNCVAIIFLAYLAINSGSSSDLSGSSNFPSRENYTAEELRTCPMKSSITVKVFRNLRGDWLTTFVNGNELRDFTRSLDLDLEKNVVECGDSRYVKISGFLKDTKANPTVTDYRISTDEDHDSCKLINECTTLVEDSAYGLHRIVELTTIAEDIAFQTNKTQQIMEQRMNSFEKTQTSFQKTLNNIEQVLNELRGILNSKKNLDTEDKENAATKPPQLINNAEAQMTFDHVHKGRSVELSSDYRTATRIDPIEDYGHSGVVTQRPLNDGETFMVRIDKTVDAHKDNGVIIGLTKMPPNAEIPETLILHRNGTWCMYSRKGQDAGYSCTVKDNKALSITYPIDTRYLPVGTTLGVRRMGNGVVHFFVNGIDKGVAFYGVSKDVHGFVDVANYVSEVSIIDQ